MKPWSIAFLIILILPTNVKVAINLIHHKQRIVHIQIAPNQTTAPLFLYLMFAAFNSENNCLWLQFGSVLSSFSVVLMSCRVNFHVVHTCYFCWSDLYRSYVLRRIFLRSLAVFFGYIPLVTMETGSLSAKLVRGYKGVQCLGGGAYKNLYWKFKISFSFTATNGKKQLNHTFLTVRLLNYAELTAYCLKFFSKIFLTFVFRQIFP